MNHGRIRASARGAFLAAVLGLPSFALYAEDGVTAGTVVIGQSASLTGPGAALGKAAREGALAYFQSVNKAGGLYGRKIDLVTLDDGFQADKAAENTRTLIEKYRVFALFGYVGGPAAAAALPIISAAKVPFVGPLNGNDTLRDPFNRYVFNVRAGFADEIEHLVNSLTYVGMTRISVFHPDDALGRKAYATAERALKKRDIQPAGAAPFARTNTNFKRLAEIVGQQNPQAVIIFGPPPIAASFIREVKAAGLNPQFSVLSTVGAVELTRDLGEDARGIAITQVVPLPSVMSIPVVREYRAAMTAAGHKELTHASLEGYINAKVIVEALRRAGSQPTREGFVRAMEGLSNFDVGGMTIGFSPTNRSGSKFIDLIAVGKGGKIIY